MPSPYPGGAPGGSHAGTLARLELRCPPLPHTLVEAMDLLADLEGADVRAVTAMVERDPLVTAHLLQKVNSAFYGLHRAVTSPERAVVLLGPVATVGIVAAMSMLRLGRPLTGAAAEACVQRLVAHSLATAHLTRYLVEEAPFLHGSTPFLRDGAAFTAGLLHDFGKFVLAYNFPEAAGSLYHEHGLAAHVATADAREQERLVFGCDHTEAGAFAAMRLSLPEVLGDVVRLHHQPAALAGGGVPPETARLLRAVSVASLAADAMGFGGGPDASWDAVPDGPALAAIVTRDVPAFGSVDALVERLQGQADVVGAHVDAVVAQMPANA